MITKKIIKTTSQTFNIIINNTKQFNPITHKKPIYFISSNQLDVNIKNMIKREQKTISKQLAILKKDLAKKQPVKNQSLYDKFHHKEIYQKIDTQIEAFFYKRSYDLQNFNFLINLLIQQKKFDYINDVMVKMKMINIEPDQKTYNYLIKAAAEQNDIKKAQQIFKKASKIFLPNKFFYTSLIKCYTNLNNSEMAGLILRQMKEKGIIPDLPVYTSIINCYRRDRNLQKCWQLHKQVIKKNKQLDQTYVGVMIKVYAASHDTQKCIKLYRQNILNKGIKPMVQTKNAYLKALAARPQYSNDAIDLFFNMYEGGDIITEQSIRWGLKACSTSANLRSAIQILKIMKIQKIQPTKQIYNSLLRVYGKVCDIPDMRQDYVDMILTDTFKLLQQIQKKNMVDTTIVNNVLNVFAIAQQVQKVDGLILPLYEKFGLQYNSYTYQILMGMYFKSKDLNTAMRIWKQAKFYLQQKKQKAYGAIQNPQFVKKHLQKRQQNRQTFNMMHMYLEIGIRMMDMNMVLDGLKMFKQIKRMPKNSILKMLGQLKNLPEQIQVSLMDFDIKFGAAKISKKNQGNKEDPQNK